MIKEHMLDLMQCFIQLCRHMTAPRKPTPPNSDTLPLLPNEVWQDDPHDLPVPQGTLLVPLSQGRSVIIPQNAGLLDSHEVLVRDLVLGYKKVLPGAALEEVCGGSLAERDGAVGLDAEDDHICKVTFLLLYGILIARILAEDTAGRKDLLDGVDDDLGWREGEIPSVVLRWQVSVVSRDRAA